MKGVKKPGLRFNPGLVLISFQTAGPRSWKLKGLVTSSQHIRLKDPDIKQPRLVYLLKRFWS